MENVTISRKGNIVSLSFDATKQLGVSTSGKSNKVASTGGNVGGIEGFPNLKIGFNAYTPVREAVDA